MKPFLLMEGVGVNENVADKAAKRGRALRAFLKRLRRDGLDTVGMVDAAMQKGLTRNRIAADLGVYLRDMPLLEGRAARRRWTQEADQRLRRALIA